MNHDSTWQAVDDIGKEFDRPLLVFYENARLDVRPALKHGCLTNGKRKKTILQEYEEANRGWIPSRPLLDFKEDLESMTKDCLLRRIKNDEASKNA